MNESLETQLFPLELAVWLSRHGFDALEAHIGNRATPLMHASRFGEYAIVETLLALGADRGCTNSDGNNALWLACFNGDLAVIRLLLTAGVPLNQQNDNGATALMYAASAGKASVVAPLLAAGADTSLCSLDGF
ncbi:MAG TPA: ankyrin repeat domain-containing protein, partial [Polyangiaceae bacterium]